MHGDGVTDTRGALRPGHRLGSFTVLAELASGGMGRIYLARSPGGRTVAVKTLLGDGAGAPAGTADRRRFAREVALARRVRGVYTASVVDADATGPVPWMATEYVPAPSLRDLVDGCGPLRGGALYWVAAGIAEALVSIHEAGLVHRDVKPSNVLLPVDGPRVIDFGISQAGDLTRTQTALGTIVYAAPEQARGEPTTPASDVFSMGATLFHLAVGRAPYRDGGAGAAVEQLVRAATGELDVSGLPRELEPLVLPCLALDPAERPTPADVLALCGARLGQRPDARGGADWLDARWLAAIERHRERRTRAVEEARRRVGPDAPTGPVAPPPPTARFAPAVTAPSAPATPRRRVGARWWAGGAVAPALALAGLLVLEPWAADGEAGAAGLPDQPVRILPVESESFGVCPEGAPEGRAYTSDDRQACVITTGDGMTVRRFTAVRAYEDKENGMGWVVDVTFQAADREKWAELTGQVAGRPVPGDQLAFVQGDKRLLAAPKIMERISGARMTIATALGRNEAEFLAKALGAP